MFKKLVIGCVLLAAAAVLLFGTSAISYVRTSAGYVSEAVQESVPIEFQIDRARGMLKDLIPEVRKNMMVIAKEEVEVKRLEEQIQQTENRLAKEKEQLLRLQADLTSGAASFKYAGRSYTADQVKQDLASRFERYKTGEATLASLQQMHAARMKSLEAARRKLEGMLAARRQLAVEVENLEARLQMINAAKTTSAYQFDDSQLGRVKQLVADLRARLDVAERLLAAENSYNGEIQLDSPTPENIVEEVAEYFRTQNDQRLASNSQN